MNADESKLSRIAFTDLSHPDEIRALFPSFAQETVAPAATSVLGADLEKEFPTAGVDGNGAVEKEIADAKKETADGKKETGNRKPKPAQVYMCACV